jgi:FAD/FMN-containing dehydrogenase
VNAAYLEDASGYRGEADRLFIPENEPEIADILRHATSLKVPVTVVGAGTGITGARVAHGGWVLSVERLNRIEVERGRAIVGPAVLLRDLQSAAVRTGQFYAPDPTETAASIGGTIATNASGSRSFRYGDTRRHVLRLRVVLASGEIVDVRRGQAVDFDVPPLPVPQTTKHTAGYPLRPGMDWVDLFVGSEGTLGTIAEAEVQLLPAPGELLAGVVFFPDDDSAVDAVEAWRDAAPRMLEYMDEPSLGLLRGRFSEIPREARAAILVEDDRDLDGWLDRIESSGALIEGSWFATSPADRERFRVFRHALPEAVNDIVRRNRVLKMNSDYAVPFDRNREMLHYYRTRLEAEFPGQYVLFGHIGDAHVHANILSRSKRELEHAGEMMIEFARKAVALGGTVSAEHGLGKRKAHLLNLLYSPEQIESMKSVKRRLDPAWILAPGNIFPAPHAITAT